MDIRLIEELIFEIRADYQIPPYLSSETIERSIRTCAAALLQMNPLTDFDNQTSRRLLRDYVYYDINHRSEEFPQNYAADILAWQLSQEVVSSE